MNAIGFFTPVVYQTMTKTFSEHCLERVDEYFYLGNQPRFILLDLNAENSTYWAMQKGQDSPPSWPQIALKVISYCTLILPLLALGAKAILRSSLQISTVSRLNLQGLKDYYRYVKYHSQSAKTAADYLERQFAVLHQLLDQANLQTHEIQEFISRLDTIIDLDLKLPDSATSEQFNHRVKSFVAEFRFLETLLEKYKDSVSSLLIRRYGKYYVEHPAILEKSKNLSPFQRSLIEKYMRFYQEGFDGKNAPTQEEISYEFFPPEFQGLKSQEERANFLDSWIKKQKPTR